MAKKKDEEKEQVVQPATISAVTQSETADTNLGEKTPQEIRNERADAIKQQRDIISNERKADNTNQANIDLAKQNIETLRSNAKLNIEQAKTNRRDKYADEAISSVAKWIEDTGGQPLTEESLANILTPKQLWHFQKKYNQGSNWGNALGGRAFFGNLNDRTVQLLTEQANKRIAANKKAANERKTYVPYGDVEGGFEINNSRLNDIKDWGNGVTDDNITPEQAQALYAKLESYGMQVPKKTVPVLDAEGKETKDANGNVITQEVYDTDGTSTIAGLYAKLGTVNGVDDNEDVLDELGFRDGAGNIARPHRKTYEEILAEQEKRQKELEYINQQKALARQQARVGLADIAAGIGDIIKASGGALVDKRDYQDMYNRLTAQQQKNFDNYLARMEALKQEEKAKQKEAADRAYQEKMLATQHERDMEKLLQAQGFQAGESALDRDLKRKLLEKELKAKEAIAKLGEDAEVAKKVTAAQLEAMKNNVNIPVGDKTYNFGNRYAADTALSTAHGVLWDVLYNEDGTFKQPYSTIIKNLEGNGIDKPDRVRAVVLAALNSEEVSNNPELLKRLQRHMVQASSGVDAPADTPSGQSNGGMY